MKKFLFPIVVFTLLLFAIPFLLAFDFYSVAKIFGILVVILFSFSIRFWLHRTRKEFNPRERVRLNLNDRYWMRNELENYSKLSIEDQKAYEDRIGIFLSNVPIVLSSGKLYTDRRKAILLASKFVDHIGFSRDLRSQLPVGVVLDEEIVGVAEPNFGYLEHFHKISLSKLTSNPEEIGWSKN